MVEVTFVVALPGWEVLYFFKGGRFQSTPVVAWGVTVDENGFTRISPVTTDMQWSLDDDRALCSPDGVVTLGELERWETVWEWLADMVRRERGEPDKLPAPRPEAVSQSPGNAPVVLNNYRKRFMTPHGDTL